MDENRFHEWPETYVEDADRAGDPELADFFKRAQEASRKGGEQGKAMLAQRLGSWRRRR